MADNQSTTITQKILENIHCFSRLKRFFQRIYGFLFPGFLLFFLWQLPYCFDLKFRTECILPFRLAFTTLKSISKVFLRLIHRHKFNDFLNTFLSLHYAAALYTSNCYNGAHCVNRVEINSGRKATLGNIIPAVSTFLFVSLFVQAEEEAHIISRNETCHNRSRFLIIALLMTLNSTNRPSLLLSQDCSRKYFHGNEKHVRS